MAGSLNKVTLIGNLGQDPEIRNMQDGRKLATFSLATSENWRDRSSGERRERTEWHRIVVFSEGLVRVIEQYIKKGSKLYIEGQLQTRKWTDQNGQDRYTTEVVLQNFNSSLIMLDGRSGGSAGSYDQGGYGESASQAAPFSGESGFGGGSAMDDDIPF